MRSVRGCTDCGLGTVHDGLMSSDLPTSQGSSTRIAGRPARDTHCEHAWPLRAEDWDGLMGCRRCGLALLRTYTEIAEWVVRRVEAIEFVDDRTVRRRVSVDYTVPREAVSLQVCDGQSVRVLPLAMMRRKSMINFDLRDQGGRSLSLLGLRENQALTLGVVRSWASALLAPSASKDADGTPSSSRLDQLIDDVIAGDQSELALAWDEIEALELDPRFMAVLERLAGNFVLFGIESAPPGTRRIVKWCYDEPLTLLHSTSSYQGHADGPCPGEPVADDEREPVTYGRTGRRQSWLEPDPLLAGLGLQPTLIRFPTPGAELAASFHFEITAPPEVSIVQASLLAGPPNLRFATDPVEDNSRWKQWSKDQDARGRPRRHRLRRRPSFDSVGGGYPTVDLHVADVPYGSLCRAQVELQASPKGWLANASLAAVLATFLLTAGWISRPEKADLPTLVLISYAAAMVAVVVRPDPHLMVTRLLAYARMLAAASAVLTLAGALAFALLPVSENNTDPANDWLLALAAASLIPSVILGFVWWLARRRLVRDRAPRCKRTRRPVTLIIGGAGSMRRRFAGFVGRRGERSRRPGRSASNGPTSWAAARRRMRTEHRTAPQILLSPWEQHTPRTHFSDEAVNQRFHVDLAGHLDDAKYPYDEAVVRLGFDRPGVKVASLEGERVKFPWTMRFDAAFREALDRELGRATGGAEPDSSAAASAGASDVNVGSRPAGTPNRSSLHRPLAWPRWRAAKPLRAGLRPATPT
jgi:hypothetical protein